MTKMINMMENTSLDSQGIIEIDRAIMQQKKLEMYEMFLDMYHDELKAERKDCDMYMERAIEAEKMAKELAKEISELRKREEESQEAFKQYAELNRQYRENMEAIHRKEIEMLKERNEELQEIYEKAFEGLTLRGRISRVRAKLKENAIGRFFRRLAGLAGNKTEA